MPLNLQNAPQIVTAIGGLGTAAFALVDSTKALWFGGVNRIGFSGITAAVTALTPSGSAPSNALSQEKILDTLRANWYNGTDLGSQKAIAKSLIKLNLSAANAAVLARATGVDAGILTEVAESIASGTTLTPAQSDVFARFDLIVTALLDEAYERGDQSFKNGTRFWAMVFSLILAYYGCKVTGQQEWWMFLLVGVLATPLAPVAKDLSTALATAVNTLQLVKK